MNRLTTEEFIEKSNIVHNNKYDYSEVDYKGTHKRVNIICREHGIFEQKPNVHLSGSCCPKCSGKFMDREYFIERAIEVHGDKYDYLKVVYKKSNKKVSIICREHGIFEQRPNSHLSGMGCPKCAGRYMDREYFIEKSNIIHNNKYDYRLVDYKKNDISVKIICSDHGIFEQSPNNHLRGGGCIECYKESIRSDFYTPDEFTKYKRKVENLTRRVKKEVFKNWDGKDYYDGEYIRCYMYLGYNDYRYPTIDHKKSIKYCLENGISVEECCSIDNLCITKRGINSSKRYKTEEEYLEG